MLQEAVQERVGVGWCLSRGDGSTSGDLQFEAPRLECPGVGGPGDQMIRIDRDVQVDESCTMSQVVQLATHERVEASGPEGTDDALEGALQVRVDRVVPQQLAVEVLQQHGAIGPGDA